MLRKFEVFTGVQSERRKNDVRRLYMLGRGRHDRIPTRDVPLEARLEDLSHERVDARGVGTVLAGRGGQIGLSQEAPADPRHIENLIAVLDPG